ncbi:uncharacterized protein LOC124712085 [Schistocerca piceifrons]|uniref:uncharacterized protein LOC124712085 n=1 Tax=Schistocerca piceifrons TaxID=274613 RepID=UPI001F5FE844|nr:uncharacterized protein LOC124712085 [Schistocerca piceifrons]
MLCSHYTLDGVGEAQPAVRGFSLGRPSLSPRAQCDADLPAGNIMHPAAAAAAAAALLLCLLEGVYAGLEALTDGAPVLPTLPGNKEVRYDFRYAVDDAESGVVSDRWESRVGEYVKGAYSLLGPDGKVRTVDYEVDGDNGFHAVVRSHPPPNALLSSQQLSRTLEGAPLPPVNVLTDRKLPVDKRPAPGNFHSAKPYYYLAFAKDRLPAAPGDIALGAGVGGDVEGGGGGASPSEFLLPPSLALRLQKRRSHG